MDLIDSSSENETSVNNTSHHDGDDDSDDDSDDGDNTFDDVNDLTFRLLNVDINSKNNDEKKRNGGSTASEIATATTTASRRRRRLVKLSSKQNQQYRDSQINSDSDDDDYHDDLYDSSNDSISISSNEDDDRENVNAENPKKRGSKTIKTTTTTTTRTVVAKHKSAMIDLVDTSEDEMENEYCSESEEVGGSESNSDSEAENKTRRMIQQRNEMKRFVLTKNQYGILPPSRDSISLTSSVNDCDNNSSSSEIVQSDDDDDDDNVDNESVISSDIDGSHESTNEENKNQKSNSSSTTTNWKKTKIDESYYYTLPTTKQRSSSTTTTIASKENDQPIQYPKIRIPTKLYNKLYDHQRVGVEWIASLHVKGIGGILGDDMGLGKTMQTLTSIGGLMDAKTIRNALVICPKSVLLNWEREARDVLVNYCGLNVDIVVLDSSIRQEKRERLLLQALNR